MSAPTTITVQLDWSHHLMDVSSGCRQTWGGPEETMEVSPVTIEDLILNGAIKEVARTFSQDRDVKREIQDKVQQTITDHVQKLVTEAVSSFIKEPIQPTDGFGSAKGEPTSFAALLDAQVAQAITKRTRSNGLDNVQETIIERAVRTEIKDTVTKAVKAEVGAQRDAIVKKVAASTASVLTEGLKRATGL